MDPFCDAHPESPQHHEVRARDRGLGRREKIASNNTKDAIDPSWQYLMLVSLLQSDSYTLR